MGSSINLSKRLADSFTPSYLKTQAERGIAIRIAILKHGFGNFSIQVIELGSSPERGNVQTSDEFIALEQYLLDTYVLA